MLDKLGPVTKRLPSPSNAKWYAATEGANWQNARGYEVLDVLLQPLRPALANQTARVSDPTQTGRRPRVQGELPAGAPLIIHYVVRKPLTPKRAKRAYQTDYEQRWND